MKFARFQTLVQQTFGEWEGGGCPPVKYENIEPEQLPPLVLAYIGDCYFSLYVRTKLLSYEQNKVRILHTYGAQMVSAVMQAKALHALEPLLTEAERELVRRGRNAKSAVPKSASVSEYRYSTGFEALLGYLFLQEEEERLAEIVQAAFAIIAREMTVVFPQGPRDK